MRMRLPLALAVGWFIWRMPGLSEESLPGFLGRIVEEREGRCGKMRRIARWRRRWLRVPGLRGRDNCYVRAVVMFRFLEVEGLRFHLGTEPPRGVGDVPHGHAWVTAEGPALEALPVEIRERVVELYAYPPRVGVEGKRVVGCGV